jgi:phenylacetate-CoA ligase
VALEAVGSAFAGGDHEMSSVAAKAHTILSLKLLVPLSRMRRLARPRLRPVMRAYYDGMRLRGEFASLGFAEKRAWVLKRLRLTLRRAYAETDYYRELFDKAGFDPAADFGFDDFARLPVLGREDVHAAGKALVSEQVPRDQLRKDSTGGSTGVPTEVWMGPEERGWRESAGEYFMRRLGMPAGTRTAYFWGHHLDPKGRDSLRERCNAFENNTRYFDCFRLSPEVLDGYHRQFERWRPACIVAYASALGQLAEHILERAIKPTYPTGCFVTGAEKLLPRHREAIEAAFGRPVHERYGSRDVGYMAFQMEPHRSLVFEVDAANLLVEPETGERESSILITKLHADAMPMIRYRVGDVGRFAPGSGPGHPAFVINEVVGRDLDRIWLPDGRWIHGIEIPHMMKDYPVREYTFVQRNDYSVEVRIVPKNGFGEDDRQRIFDTVQANLPGLRISTLVVDEIQRTVANKWRPIVSEVK